MTMLMLLLALLMPSLAHATVDWSDSFEYASYAALTANWPDQSQGCAFGTPTPISVSTDRAFTGTRSLKMFHRGHQANPDEGLPATVNHVECDITRALPAPSDTLYTRRYIYFDNFAIDYLASKSTRHFNFNTYPGFWWYVGYCGGASTLPLANRFACPTVLENENYDGNGNTQSLHGGTIPQNQWVCEQTRITMSTPGVSDGIVQQWLTPMNTGVRSQTMNFTNVPMRRSTLLNFNGPNSQIGQVKVYVQDGGVLASGTTYANNVYYIDDLAVSRDALIPCSGAPATDSTPPTTPGSVSASVSGSVPTTINVAHAASSDPESGVSAYRVRECHSGPTCTPSTIAKDENTLSHAITGLLEGTLYRFTVEAYNSVPLTSTPSATVSATTGDTTAPSIPTGVTIQ